MDSKMKAMVAIGASVASGCVPCLDTHVDQARAAGADTQEIEIAVNIARAVRLQAITGFDDAVRQALRGDPIAVVASQAGCGPHCNC